MVPPHLVQSLLLNLLQDLRTKIYLTGIKINLQVSRRKKNKQQVSRTEISKQKVPQTNIRMQQTYEPNQLQEKNKLMQKFPKEKTQHTTSFTNKKSPSSKFLEQNISTIRSFRTKIIFTGRKTNVQVSQRRKSTCNKFQKQNPHETSSTNKTQYAISPMNKISSTRIKINIQASRREK